jgi:hypothetical protein
MVEEIRPGIEYSQLQLDQDTINSELMPSLRTLKEELAQKGVSPLLWFLFGSAVIEDPNTAPILTDSEVLVRTLLGIRDKNSFRSGSDIDLGLIVKDEEYDTELDVPNLSISKRNINGHRLELTRFDLSWLGRRGHTVETLKEKKYLCDTYGSILPLDV